MKNQIVAAALAFASISAHAVPERELKLSDVSMENVTIKGRLQSWTLSKVCVDGQAYLLVLGISGPNGISPSFKDGKPEQCSIKKSKPE